eukprot:CAMPEP_0115018078 /NCGR_PEP_ID=MMETSP0216-20121206/28550_1 /TAXON_ID=223996 /ORGANISM="Protocruzia adherens, Strain Boccale" /LENGTH=198 /DNA_ID=CAMNT_0002389121 /DNA_START=597 /DNA_END=1193 /DNA_ORIENTATION=-
MDSATSPLSSARSVSGNAIREMIVKAKEKISRLTQELSGIRQENQSLAHQVKQSSLIMSEEMSKQKTIKNEIAKHKTLYSEATRQKQVLEIDYKDVRHKIKVSSTANERMATDLDRKLQDLKDTLAKLKTANELEKEQLKNQLYQEQRKHAEVRERLKHKEHEVNQMKHTIRHIHDQNHEEAVQREDDIKELRNFLAG